MGKAGDEHKNEFNPRSMTETWSTYHLLANDATTVNQSAQTASLPYGIGNARVYSTGDIVDKSYKLLGILGSGSMGVVFHCRHLILGKDYALKLLATDRLTPESWSRFQSEAKALARLHHPCVVGIHNMGIDDRACPYYVMDLLEGESLSQLIRRKKRLTVADSLNIFTQLASALDAAHQQGIVHRDIKPSNIMVLEENGTYAVKLVDFGIARLSKQGLGSLNQTAAGTVFGTPFYMSPEQSLGTTVDERSDIYSLGCTLFEALTGIPPLVGENAIETILMHQSADMPSLNEVYPDGNFSPAIEMAVSKMLQRNVSHRYQTMKQVAYDFARIQAGKAVGFSKDSSKFAHALPVPEDDDEMQQSASAREKNSIVFGPLQIALVATALLAITAGALALSIVNRPKPPSAPVSVPVPALDQIRSSEDPLSLSFKQHMNIYQTFCLKKTNAAGELVRKFLFPEINCKLGYLRVGDGLFQPAVGTIEVPYDQKAHLYLQCVATPHPEICSKFGPDDLSGLDIVTFEVPAVMKIVKNWRKLEHLSFFNSVEHFEGMDCSEILKEQLPLIDEMSGLKSLGLCGSLKMATPLHGSETTGADIAQMKLLNTIESFSLKEVNNVQPLLKVIPDHPNIKELNLVGLEIRDGDLKLLVPATDLEILRIYQCDRITSAAADILKKIPTLKEVIIDQDWQDSEKKQFGKVVNGYKYENYKDTRHN